MRWNSKISLLLLFTFFITVIPTASNAAQVFTSNFNIVFEDIPAYMISDLDKNDIFISTELKTHVDDSGKIKKSDNDNDTHSNGAENDLQMIIGGKVSNADLIVHDELDGEQRSAPFVLYEANSITNDFFIDCAQIKMVNVLEDKESCFGAGKAFSIFYHSGHEPIFANYETNEVFGASLISIKNLTLNETIDFSTNSRGFKNMTILPSDIKFTALERHDFYTEMIGEDTEFIHNGKNIKDCKPKSGRALTFDCEQTIAEFLARKTDLTNLNRFNRPVKNNLVMCQKESLEKQS